MLLIFAPSRRRGDLRAHTEQGPHIKVVCRDIGTYWKYLKLWRFGGEPTLRQSMCTSDCCTVGFLARCSFEPHDDNLYSGHCHKFTGYIWSLCQIRTLEKADGSGVAAPCLHKRAPSNGVTTFSTAGQDVAHHRLPDLRALFRRCA